MTKHAILERTEQKKVELESSMSYYTMIENPHGWDSIATLFKECPAGAGELFLAMVKIMDNRNGLVAGQQALAEYLGTSRQAINRYIKMLKERKYIEVLKSGRGCVYLINASIAWRGPRADRLLAEFDCKVLLSLSEQSKDVQRRATKAKEITDE